MWDLDVRNYPELAELCDQAVRDEHAKAHEEYKDVPLPLSMVTIKSRCVAARREAIRQYCEVNGLQIADVMANKRPVNG